MTTFHEVRTRKLNALSETIETAHEVLAEAPLGDATYASASKALLEAELEADAYHRQYCMGLTGIYTNCKRPLEAIMLANPPLYSMQSRYYMLECRLAAFTAADAADPGQWQGKARVIWGDEETTA